MHELAVTAIGGDRPGIVAAIAEVLHRRGGNVEDSAMTVLGGHFAVMLLVATEDEPAALARALTQATVDLDLTITVNPTGEGHASAAPTHVLSVYGADKPGILAGVTRCLAEQDVNITDVESRLLSPGDAPVYALVVECSIGEDGVEGVRDAVAATCTELGVDHSLRTLDTETY
ncbi:MAG: ACT domain-containing protein [Actinobacteria bacterium]|nr:ACT domain-containing protein [Actinomycetota bacterium]